MCRATVISQWVEVWIDPRDVAREVAGDGAASCVLDQVVAFGREDAVTVIRSADRVFVAGDERVLDEN